MSKILVLHSGGMDSLACMMLAIDQVGVENVMSLGFNYGQRHFEQENKAATQFCANRNIPRKVLDVNIGQIGGCSLIDKNIAVTTDMSQQRSTVVPQRNAIFLLFAAAYAQENDCNVIVHGAVQEDYEAYRDCRGPFFELAEMLIQAGRTNPVRGSENIVNDIEMNLNMGAAKVGYKTFIPPNKLDISIATPLIVRKKEQTVKYISENFGGSGLYSESYSCYNGGEIHCGKCPACVERRNAFKNNGLTDPTTYAE